MGQYLRGSELARSSGLPAAPSWTQGAPGRYPAGMRRFVALNLRYSPSPDVVGLRA